MNGVAWEISAAEHQASAAQFAALNPQMGRIDGNTARTVLMKSNLPPQILAQIWALADINRDGMLDEREYSIAIRLTKNCLAGAPLPPTLPPSLQQVPPAGMYVSQPMLSSVPPAMSSSAAGALNSFGSPPSSFPIYNTAPPSGASGAIPSTPGTPGKHLGNWTIPHNTKLKYSQQFNNFDKQRCGYLTGQVGRSALGQSGLPTPILAQIWGLSDVNKDGRLSVDEFYIAMHMIDMFKNGYALPDATPAELVQMCGISRSANNSPHLEPGAPPAQKSPAPKTFEDKRMDNFAKGQAELERRRQTLMEEENRRKAEQERREREEAEKRERERLEKERRREAERRAEMERMRMLEEARMEEERRREAEREAARQEAEKQRLVEVEKQRFRELQAHKQQEMERTAQRQQRQKTLTFQLQALDEKRNDTDGEITRSREKIKEITEEIDGMRGQRDDKMKRISELQASNQQLSVQAQELAHQLLQLQSANKDISVRKGEIEAGERRRDQVRAAVIAMQAQIEELRRKSAVHKELSEKKRSQYAQKKQELTGAREEYRRVTTLLAQLQIQARAKLSEIDAALAAKIAEEQEKQAREAQSAQQITSPVHKHNGMTSNPLPPASSSGTIKYRAVFEFVARSEDELSFQPGDVILVFEGHNAEPGWRAGQIRDKVGWFPEAFAEPIAAVSSHPSQPIQNMPPNVTPSPSLDRIPEEGAVKFHAVDDSSSAPIVMCTCVAQFPWKARNEEDLSFAKGDVIEVIQQHEMKWRGRKADGSIGWFPKSYVKVQGSSKPSSASHSMDKSSTPAAGSTAVTPSTPTTVRSLAQQMSTASSSQVPPSASQRSIASNGGEWYVAIFEFDAAESTDLPLVVGDKILVFEKNDAWWKGRCNGKEGIFPANYVEKAEEAAATAAEAGGVLSRVRAVADFDGTAANQLSLKVGDEVAVREKSDAGWWEGEVVRDGKKESGWFPGDYVVAIEGSIVTSPGEVSATALFDYVASQADELSFKTGDVIIIDSKVDAEWWTGHHPSGDRGLFPASYVQLSAPKNLNLYDAIPSLYELPPLEPPIRSAQPQLYDLPPTIEQYQSALYDVPPSAPSKKFEQLSEELLTTEERYLGDLVLAKKLFYQNLLPVVDRILLDRVFLNWDQLIDVSKRVLTRLRKDPVGPCFLAEIDAFSAFVTFCKGQQAAAEAIPQLFSSPESRSIYAQCCATARGMSLNYFLLIPLGRVTRYPLIVEKMLNECPPTHEFFADLEASLQLLRALVAEVNNAVNEIETLALLYWTQQHVKCPGLPLDFSSPTRLLGSRQFLHSGVLYKAKSNRLLVGILFNDFLLLTTPDEHISEPETFKVSKTVDTKLTLYKQPYLIEKLRFEQSKEQETFISLNYGDDVVLVKAASRNAAKLWSTQLTTVIDNWQITLAQKEEKKRIVLERPLGRLLVELMSLPNVSIKTVGSPPHLITIALGQFSSSFDIDATKEDLRLPVQFPFSSIDHQFTVTLFKKMVFQPDMPVLEPAGVPLKVLIGESSRHRGPILKPLPLRKSFSGQKNVEGVVVKFVVQLYESEV